MGNSAYHPRYSWPHFVGFPLNSNVFPFPLFVSAEPRHAYVRIDARHTTAKSGLGLWQRLFEYQHRRRRYLTRIDS